MAKSKYFDMIAILVTFAMIVVTVMFLFGERLGLSTDTVDVLSAETGIFTERELDPSWDEKTSVRIDLDDFEGLANDAAYELDGNLYLTAETTYVLKGTLAADKQVIVDAKGCKMQIVLAGAKIENDTVAPIYVKKAKKVFLTLAEDTENTCLVTTGLGEAQTEQEINAAIYSRSDLVINGNGKLIVTAKGCNGVRSSDELVITGGQIVVTADENAMVGHDAVKIGGGSFYLTAGKDGLKSNHELDETDKGNVTIVDGTLQIQAQDDGIHAENTLLIEDGTILVEDSYEGLEGADVIINGGDIQVAARDDGINAGGTGSDDLFGRFGASLGREALDSDEMLQRMNQGDIDPDGLPQKPDGGNFDSGNMPQRQDRGDFDPGAMPQKPDRGDFDPGAMPQKPDRGNFDSGNMPQRPDGEGFAPGDMQELDQNVQKSQNLQNPQNGNQKEQAMEAELAKLEINGGNIYVDAQGDGLDSNGDLVINGGTIIVHGPTNAGNGALDSGSESGGSLVIHAGEIIALGASGMDESFSEESTQYSFRMILDQSYEPGQQLTICDSKGNLVYETAICKTGTSVVFSSDKLVQNETYTVSVGQQEKTVTMDSISSGEAYRGFGMDMGRNGSR